MLKSKRQKNMLIGVITSLAVIVVFAISYAAFSQTLNINGTGHVRKSTWNIHFVTEGPYVTEGKLNPSNTISSSVKILSTPSINNTTIGDYRVSLTTPGDTISYTFDVINEGDYNAKISDFSLPNPVCKVNGDSTSTSAVNVCSKLNYTLKYDNGETVTNNDTLLSKETKTMVLTLEYEEFDNAGLLPTNDVEISNLGFTINYVQDGRALVNKDGTTPYTPPTVGSVVTLNNEEYYIINLNGDANYVTLLKANPLTVDEVNTYGVGHVNQNSKDSKKTAYNTNGYGGMQYYSNGYFCGYLYDGLTSKFCKSDYLSSEVKYVVDAWATDKFQKNELKQVDGYSARLITYDELNTLGCRKDNCSYSSYKWLYNDQYMYWTMTAANSYQVTVISSLGSIVDHYVYLNTFVVRPVINVYKSNL